MEYAVLVAIVALWVLGSLIPTGHPSQWQRVFSSYTKHAVPRRRIHPAYAKEDLRILHRIQATWRLERVTPGSDALTQHFEVLPDAASYYQTRKMH